MKLGIILLIVGVVLLTGNLIDFQLNPLWAFITRLVISISVIGGGVLRLYSKLQRQRN